MTDIVERLRAIDHMSVEDCFLQSPLFLHAANEIERLIAENAELKGALRADAERLQIAGDRVGLATGCDTADVMADEITHLRSTIGEYAHCRSCGSLVRLTGEYAFQCDCTKMGDDFAHLQRLGPHDKEAFDEIVKLHSEVSEARATGRREGMKAIIAISEDYANDAMPGSEYRRACADITEAGRAALKEMGE